jgi:hypothetical protein
LEDAKGKGLSGLFREMMALRQRDEDELAQSLRGLGREPDRDGSFMSSVHRVVIKVRSLFTDLDESILPGLIDGYFRGWLTAWRARRVRHRPSGSGRA